MLARVPSEALIGLDSHAVTVEADGLGLLKDPEARVFDDKLA